jgi:hypothetical protein
MTNISDHTFSGCSGPINFNIPDNMAHIGDNAFEGCEEVFIHLGFKRKFCA